MYQLMVFLHVLMAMVWMGSMVFVFFVLVPFMRHPEHGRVSGPLGTWVSRRFRRLAQVSLVVLLVTGTYAAYARGVTWNAVRTGLAWEGPFGQALALKLALVGLLTFLSLSADFLIVPYLQKNHQAPDKQKTVAFWNAYLRWMGPWNVATSVAIVALAVVLVRGWPW